MDFKEIGFYPECVSPIMELWDQIDFHDERIIT